MATSCDPFSVPFSGAAGDLYDAVRQMVESSHGTISGDGVGGTFTVPLPVGGEVRGSYAVSGQAVTVTVTSKPWLLPCSAIESYLRSHIP